MFGFQLRRSFFEEGLSRGIKELNSKTLCSHLDFDLILQRGERRILLEGIGDISSSLRQLLAGFFLHLFAVHLFDHRVLAFHLNDRAALFGEHRT